MLDKIHALINRNINYLFYFCLLFFSAGFFYSVYDGKFLWCQIDETAFYCSAKSFIENNSVAAPYVVHETEAKIFGSGAYGFCYTLFYGGLSKLFGFSSPLFVSVNIILVGLCLLIIWNLNLNRNQKLWISCLFLMFHVVARFTFSFFSEVLNIFFGMVLSACLIKVYETDSTPEKQSRIVWWYVFLILFFSMFRLIWCFWIIGLLPFARSRKDLFNYLIVMTGVVAFAFFFMKYFCAPMNISADKVLGNVYSFSILGFVSDFLKSIGDNFYVYFIRNMQLTKRFLITFYFYPVLTALMGWLAFRCKNKLVIAAFLIGSLSFLILFVLYSVYYLSLIKMLASAFILYVMVIVYFNHSKLKTVAAIVLLINLPILVHHIFTDTITLRKQAWVDLNENMAAHSKALGGIAALVNSGKDVKIQLLYYDDYKFPDYVFFSSLPFKTNDGHPIRYTENIRYRCEQKGTMDESCYFKRFGKWNVDFVLSAHPLQGNDKLKIAANNSFYLYKIVE